jgi:Polysaccharide deacetylase
VTNLYFTIDTEYSAGFATKHGSGLRAENFARSIVCATSEGAAGVPYQMDIFERAGIKAVFFVDPMPALVWGVEAITDIVGPIVERGHDIQLHLHSEWLKIAGTNALLGDRTGLNIKDFSFDEQCRLLDYARTTLIAAGAPRPVAFRAGNYGANDDTLRALAELGMQYDSSHCPGIASSACDISLGSDDCQPVEHCGLIEVPISAIAGPRGTKRHFQVTALTDIEMGAALRFSARNGVSSMTLVSHSFELLSRDRSRINALIKRRFERLCTTIASLPDIACATYSADPPAAVTSDRSAPQLPHSLLRTGYRYAEQAVANAFYGSK